MISRLVDWASPRQHGLVSRLVLGWEQKRATFELIRTLASQGAWLEASESD